MPIKKSQLINLLVEAVRPAIRQQIKEFFIPAVQKIIQAQFKKFKMNQKIISDSGTPRKITQNNNSDVNQFRNRAKQKLGISNFNPKQHVQQYTPPYNTSKYNPKQQNVDEYIQSILGESVRHQKYEPIRQDDNFDPMSFDATPQMINQSRYSDNYAYEEDALDDIDQTIGYAQSVSDNPEIMRKLGLRIR